MGLFLNLRERLEKEKSLLVQEKYISLSFANNITKRLAVAGYIEAEETTLALKALEEEYAGKCYMWPAKTKMGCSKVHMNCMGRDSFLI